MPKKRKEKKTTSELSGSGLSLRFWHIYLLKATGSQRLIQFHPAALAARLQRRASTRYGLAATAGDPEDFGSPRAASNVIDTVNEIVEGAEEDEAQVQHAIGFLRTGVVNVRARPPTWRMKTLTRQTFIRWRPKCVRLSQGDLEDLEGKEAGATSVWCTIGFGSLIGALAPCTRCDSEVGVCRGKRRRSSGQPPSSPLNTWQLLTRRSRGRREN